MGRLAAPARGLVPCRSAPLTCRIRPAAIRRS